MALLRAWQTSLAILGVALVLGWLFKLVLLARLRALAQRTVNRADDALVEVAQRYWLPVLLLAALVPALRFAPLPPERGVVLERFSLGLLLLLVTLAATRFVGLWFAGAPRPAGGPTTRPTLLQRVSQSAVVIAGLMLVLDNAGVDIKTLLTALGVGSLAIALALQPTLSNLFAGIHLSVSKPLRVGDFIELEDGLQGHVVDIGWRATRIHQLAGNLAVVPNARLSDMRLINYSLPALPQSIIVKLGIAYGSDLRRVEQAALEVARSVQKEVAEADPAHEPSVLFHTLGPSSIDCNVVLRARAYTDRWPLIHEFVVRLEERFEREGFELPIPQRVVQLSSSRSDPAS